MNIFGINFSFKKKQVDPKVYFIFCQHDGFQRIQWVTAYELEEAMGVAVENFLQNYSQSGLLGKGVKIYKADVHTMYLSATFQDLFGKHIDISSEEVTNVIPAVPVMSEKDMKNALIKQLIESKDIVSLTTKVALGEITSAEEQFIKSKWN